MQTQFNAMQCNKNPFHSHSLLAFNLAQESSLHAFIDFHYDLTKLGLGWYAAKYASKGHKFGLINVDSVFSSQVISVNLEIF